MGKIKDIFHGEHKIFAYFVAVVGSAFIFSWVVGPGTTVIHWARSAMEVSRQEKRIKELKLENERLDRRINLLENNRDTLEKYAREQYHFAAPGDDVYLLGD